MTALSRAAGDYLALRRSLGHKLDDAGRLLPRFIDYLDREGIDVVTSEAALAWAQRPDADPGSIVWARRLTVARGFARHMAGIDPRTQIPPAGLIGYRQRRRPPFIFSDAAITAVMAQARAIRWPLPALTHEALIGLLAATGMRVGEALRLDRADIDWAGGIVLIRQSKFTKSRQVALHPTAMEALAAYSRRRDELRPDCQTPAFFVSMRGTRVIYAVVQEVFRNCCRASGVESGSAVTPRVHDLRHSFAVGCLLRWYREGADVQSRLPWLSAYLGHKDPRSTYWYLSAAPELLACAARLLRPAAGRRRHDRDRAHPPGVLHRAADQAARRQSRTIASYRDTLRLLLAFARDRTGKQPAALDWDDLDAATISAFLDHLQASRGNGARTRNLRLTAIRSLIRWASLRHPEHAAVFQQILAIPPKRADKRTITFLDPAEAQALIDAPDHTRWEGRRDRAIIVLALQVGLRVSELTSLDRGDITLGTGSHVRCEGKGRKQRAVPLTSQAQPSCGNGSPSAAATRRPALPHPHRAAPEPRRHRAADPRPRRHRRGKLPVPAGQEPPPARAQAQLRHGPAPGRRRHDRHRPMARARRHPLHPDLPARRSDHQGTSPRADYPGVSQARPLQAPRRRPRLPRKPVTMPISDAGHRPRSPP